MHAPRTAARATCLYSPVRWLCAPVWFLEAWGDSIYIIAIFALLVAGWAGYVSWVVWGRQRVDRASVATMLALGVFAFVGVPLAFAYGIINCSLEVP